MDWLVYVFYGFISGLGELLPVSAGAHDYFLELMTRFDTQQPLLQLCIHAAALLAVCIVCRHRTAHIYRELQLASQPAGGRKRQPDMVAVLDGRVVLTLIIPAMLGVLLSTAARQRFDSLPSVVLMLTVNGIFIFVPHYLQGANRDSRHLSRLEAIFFGVCAAFSALPGISRLGALLSAGALRGCSRGYLLDIALLVMIPVLALMALLDLFALFAAGFAILSLLDLLYCMLAAVAAFGGAWLAIAAMRYLSVNMGYTTFSYYSWGLAAFGFILYLMI